jgi:hypothetical protein
VGGRMKSVFDPTRLWPDFGGTSWMCPCDNARWWPPFIADFRDGRRGPLTDPPPWLTEREWPEPIRTPLLKSPTFGCVSETFVVKIYVRSASDKLWWRCSGWLEDCGMFGGTFNDDFLLSSSIMAIEDVAQHLGWCLHVVKFHLNEPMIISRLSLKNLRREKKCFSRVCFCNLTSFSFHLALWSRELEDERRNENC